MCFSRTQCYKVYGNQPRFLFFKKVHHKNIPQVEFIGSLCIHLGGSIVDSDYRGNIKVILTNLANRRVEWTLILLRSWALMTVFLKEVPMTLVQQENRKNVRDCSRKFLMSVTNLSKRISCLVPFEQREYLDTIHNVSFSCFVIFISFDHKNLCIKTFLSKILKEAKESELFRFG